MFNIDFAYTDAMQVILFFASCITTIIFYSYTTNLILLIYGEKVSFKRKAVYVLLTGLVLNNFWTYGIYALGGLIDFSPIVYKLVTVPNPVFGLLYYLFGVKILKLSPYRSVRLLSNAYIFIMVIKMFQRMVGFIFFAQLGGQYNYLLDTVSVIVCTVLYSAIYFALKKWIVKSQLIIGLTDSEHSRPLWKELILAFLKASAVYAFLVLYPMYANVNRDLYLFIMLAFVVFAFVMNLLNDHKISLLMEIKNKSTHIKILNETVDGFSGLRHDINNILQTYGGYIATENWGKLGVYHKSLFDTTVLLNESTILTRKLEENPTLISLLMQKHKAAKAVEVNMRVNILCNIGDLNIGEMDLCRAIGNLLDNAIEAAKEAPKKWIDLSIEEKENTDRLIVISNSTKEEVDIASAMREGVTSKEGHTGMGINHTRRLLSKYPNCAFQISYYEHEFTAYISISV